MVTCSLYISTRTQLWGIICLEILQFPRYLTLHIIIFVQSLHLKLFSHKTTFEEIFLNNVVAYAFTYTQLQWYQHSFRLRNVQILRYI